METVNQFAIQFVKDELKKTDDQILALNTQKESLLKVLRSLKGDFPLKKPRVRLLYFLFQIGAKSTGSEFARKRFIDFLLGNFEKCFPKNKNLNDEQKLVCVNNDINNSIQRHKDLICPSAKNKENIIVLITLNELEDIYKFEKPLK